MKRSAERGVEREVEVHVSLSPVLDDGDVDGRRACDRDLSGHRFVSCFCGLLLGGERKSVDCVDWEIRSTFLRGCQTLDRTLRMSQGNANNAFWLQMLQQSQQQQGQQQGQPQPQANPFLSMLMQQQSQQPQSQQPQQQQGQSQSQPQSQANPFLSMLMQQQSQQPQSQKPKSQQQQPQPQANPLLSLFTQASSSSSSQSQPQSPGQQPPADGGFLGQVVQGIASHVIRTIAQQAPSQKERPRFQVSLSRDQLRHFAENGYLRIENVVQPALIAKALAAINSRLGKGIPESVRDHPDG